jgi:C4-dicarboxylate-specific signal transduction histidine kinase
MMRSRQLQKKLVDLHSVVNDSLALVSYDIRTRQIEVSVNLSMDSCVVSGDPVLLQQVLVNLLVNAMDALAETPPHQRHVMISSEARRADVELSVRDTGPGLPMELIDRLFTPFFTTKPHGLGIGLAIARTIVEAHGGSIRARNAPGGGAIFTISLRLREALEAAAAPPVIDGVASGSPKG